MTETWQILVVDSDQRTCQIVKDCLEVEGLAVTVATSSQSGLAFFKRHTVHLVISEAHFDTEIDFSLVSQLADISNVPIVVLSTLAHDAHRIKGFELGIADYLVKPFSARELALRVKRLLVYFYSPSPFKLTGSQYVFTDMTLDVAKKRLVVEQKNVHLTPREFQLLHYFVEHPNQVLSRRELLRDVWGYQYLGEERSVDVQVRALRNKLKQYSPTASQRIQTEHNRGYCFKP